MKKVSLLLVILISISTPILLFPQIYHSTAGIPQKSKSTTTEMTLINLQFFEFAILSAVDTKLEGKEHYILFAPVYFPSDKPTLDELTLNYSTILTLKNAEELATITQKALDDWNNKYPDDKGIFLEYSCSQEQDIKQISPNVELWIPGVKFNYHNIPNQKKASILLGEYFGKEGTKYLFTLEYISLRYFNSDLRKAIEDLKSKMN